VLPYFREFQAIWQAIGHLPELVAEFIVDIQGGIGEATTKAEAFKKAMASIISSVIGRLATIINLVVRFSNFISDVINNQGSALETLLKNVLTLSFAIGGAWSLITGSILGAVVAALGLLTIFTNMAYGDLAQGEWDKRQAAIQAAGGMDEYEKRRKAEIYKKNFANAKGLDGSYYTYDGGPRMSQSEVDKAIDDMYEKEISKHNLGRPDNSNPLTKKMDQLFGTAGGWMKSLIGENPFGVDTKSIEKLVNNSFDMLNEWKYEDPLVKELKENTKALHYTSGALADFHGFVDIARRNLSVLGGQNAEGMYGNLNDMNLNKYAYDPVTGTVHSQDIMDTRHSPLNPSYDESSSNSVMNLSVTQNINTSGNGSGNSMNNNNDDLADKIVDELVKAFEQAGGYKIINSKPGLGR
jgi:hypothetical protein